MSKFFKITFYGMSLHNNRREYRAYSNNNHDMDLFIRQHCLSPNNVEIVEIDKEDTFSIGRYIIEPHKFKSNKYNQTSVVYTTEELVNEAAAAVCDNLSDVLMFGSPIERQDIGLMNLIASLVYALDYVFILDFNLMDCDSLDYIYPEQHEMWGKRNTTYDWYDEGFDSYIYDTILECVSNVAYVMPITLESYVSNFVDILTDTI